MREAEVIIDFAPLHRSKIEIKPLEVEDEIVWDVLQTGSAVN